MDELKKLIAENREMFDATEPLDGHFDRFFVKINKDTAKRPAPNWMFMLKVASVAVLVMLSGLYVTEHLINYIKSTSYTQTNPEFNETKAYYINMVDQKMGVINTLDESLSNEQREMLLEEMSQMDDMYKKLQNDLKAMPNDPRIMQAMLQHYQMKMEILNRIINDLQNVQQLNYPSHENIEL